MLIVKSGERIGNSVADAGHMHDTYLGLGTDQLVYRKNEQIVIWCSCFKGVPYVDSVLVIGVDHNVGEVVTKRDDGSIDLFLLFMGKPKFVPKLEKFCLIGWKVAIVLVVKLHVAQVGERAVVVDVTFEVLDSLNIQRDPADQRDESQIDIIGSSATKAVAPVNMPSALKCDHLFQLPQGCHRDVAVGTLYIRLIDDKLYLVTMFPAICPQGGPKGLNAIHASTSNIVMADHGIR